MSDHVPRRYTQNHEWLHLDGELAVVGITDHAQQALGDVVFVDLPQIGRTLKRGESFGTVESVKAVSDLYAPIGGEVVAVNEGLADAPDTVNSDCYGSAWMVRLRPSEPTEADQLLDEDAYTALLAAS